MQAEAVGEVGKEFADAGAEPDLDQQLREAEYIIPYGIMRSDKS